MAGSGALKPSLAQRCACELVGTAFLLLAVVGSGVMAVNLCGGNNGLALLANALATAGALYALISTFGPVSGAHFNPAVTLFALLRGEMRARDGGVYVLAQCVGAWAGVVLAHLLFLMTPLQWGTTVRADGALVLSECVATFGLLLIIAGTSARCAERTALVVALWIMGAYWFTSSTSFANPAVTLARACTDTFAGIRPVDTPAFLAAQICTGLFAAMVLPWLLALPRERRDPIADKQD